MGLAGAHAAEQHDVGRLRDELAAEQFKHLVAVETRLRGEIETIQGLENREVRFLDATLDPPLAPFGDLEADQVGQVLATSKPTRSAR
jgi:hypothetical protein